MTPLQLSEIYEVRPGSSSGWCPSSAGWTCGWRGPARALDPEAEILSHRPLNLKTVLSGSEQAAKQDRIWAVFWTFLVTSWFLTV